MFGVGHSLQNHTYLNLLNGAGHLMKLFEASGQIDWKLLRRYMNLSTVLHVGAQIDVNVKLHYSSALICVSVMVHKGNLCISPS